MPVSTLKDLFYPYNVNFPVGEALKALYRMGRKDGIDAQYDLRKVSTYIHDEYVRCRYYEPHKVKRMQHMARYIDGVMADAGVTK